MPVKKNCEVCGEEYLVKGAKYDGSRFCSRTCMATGMKGKRRSKGTEFRKGQRPHNYNGGRTKSKGYILLAAPEHPRANMNGYVSEHILVWERENGRLLPQGWVVHHINGVRHDNRPENLQGMTREKHHPALDPAYIKARLRQIETELDCCRNAYLELEERYEKLLRETRDT